MPAVRNWARMRSTGGTGAFALTPIVNTPTFKQSLQIATGTVEIDYVARAPNGMRETGTGTFDATTGEGSLSRDTILETFDPAVGVDTTSPTPLNFPDGTVIGFDMRAQDIQYILASLMGLGSASLEDVAAFSPAGHTHDFTTLVGILGSRTVGKVLTVDADNNPIWGTLTAESIGGEPATNADIRAAAGTAVRPLPYSFKAVDGLVPLLELPDGVNATVARLIQQPKDGAGSANLTVKIGTTNVTGLVNIAAPSTRTETTSTAANAAVAGNVVWLEVSSTSGDVYIEGQVELDITD